MIQDILDVEQGAEVRGDVAVVGSGVAGVELALFLSRHGLRVVLLESGRRDYDAAIQALNAVQFVGKPHRKQDPDGDVHPYLAPHYRGVSRVRQFGGTSNVWTGKWRAFTPRDLERRPWLDDPGWPFTFGDLLPHYRACFEDYGLGDVVEEAENPEMVQLNAALRADGLVSAVFYWEHTPTRTRIRFGDALRESKHVTVVLGATATELLLDERLDRVRTVTCQSLEGRRITVHAGIIVLATGGFETPRLLLASNRQIPAGIGNAHDLVGRYYIDHPKNQTGRLLPGPRLAALAHRLQFHPRPRFGMCFALSDEVQRRHGLLGHSVYLRPVYESQRQRASRLLARQKAFLDENGRLHHYAVKVAFEQAPHRNSRVYLGPNKDALGVPELVVDWQFTDGDHHTIATACRELRKTFEEAGLGTLELCAEPMTMEVMTDAAHQMGTTRMAARPEDGVVDLTCRVFGCQNLYVASAAVFPTCQPYSPTLTILALARRLGVHLLRCLAQ